MSGIDFRCAIANQNMSSRCISGIRCDLVSCMSVVEFKISNLVIADDRFWDCGFESLRGHGCFSVVCVGCVVR